MIQQSLGAGLMTGVAMAALMFVIFFRWEGLRILWPLAFVPVFTTGVFAVHRAGPAIWRGSQAALAGALGGLAAAAVSLVAVILVSMLGGDPNPYPVWNLVPVLLDSPFFVPPSVLFYDLPGLLPFPWPLSGRTPEGAQFSRIPWTLPLFLPVGALLSALQAWLYYLLARQADVAARAAGRIAQLRAGYQAKLLAGFLLVTMMVFAVGWLGWAATEEMHLEVHEGRAMQHWADHALRVQADLRAQTEALSRLRSGSDDAAAEEVSALGQQITAELRHLKTIPPPLHPATSTGSTGRPLRMEGKKRLPAVREADSRFADLNTTTGQLVDLYGAGDSAEAEALLRSLGPLRAAVEAPLQELTSDLNQDLVKWQADADGAAHGQQFITLLVLLLATAVAFPLGYVFSQVVVRPVDEVRLGLAQIGSGEFTHRIQVQNRDELGDLAEGVSDMSTRLQGVYQELWQVNEKLQQKVEDQLGEIDRARVLRRYLSPQVADSIIAGESQVQLATTRKNLTIAFIDIRGFTGISERMEPEELIDLLNGYFTAQTEIVFKHGGTLDKYYGDGMMVFFGDPIPYDDHAKRAVRMALEMRAKLPELQARWFMHERETLNIGVGISTGYVTVGNIGSPVRLDYTVIGNIVNLASRLSDMASPGQILVTERTMVEVRELVRAEEHGEVMVEGSARPVRVYEIPDQPVPVT